MSHQEVYRDGELHVLSEKCSTCIYRPGNLMQLNEGRREQMAADAATENSVIPCHQTIYEPDVMPSVCRGYWDTEKRNVMSLRLAVAMEIVNEQPPPTKEKP